MFSFTFTPSREEYADGHRIVQMSGLNADAKLTSVIDLFSDYLRAVGYVFHEIEVVIERDAE